MFKFDIDINELLYSDLPIINFAQRFRKAKLYADISQSQLSKLTGLSKSTINDLESGYRQEIKKDTLLKLLTVLDSKILCDDYCYFILNQKYYIEILINKFTIKYLARNLNINRSTIERWRDNKYQVNRQMYTKLNSLFNFIKQ
ncbi:helix-turn-helix domain-containing protein [Clostridium butyricum]|uniref:helix-turn-helix domain-containing protein n=1 Tax=Clostridium butyricum TaxID=1492 RepID=UPI00041A5FCD|nr:helix-turn-helix transcriptional regulator [Clostridium butyricum]